ncbi:MAG: aminoacyl-tRNA hydrolase [Mariprofundaceae bacterium]
MKLLVGLGNPGEKYKETRHNIGFRFLDKLAKHEGMRFTAAPRFRAETCSWDCGGQHHVTLVKPQTYMNDSGESVGLLARYYQLAPEDIVVIFDDLDLSAGKIRVRSGGGHGGHNGLKSLNNHLDNSNYHRVKIGIGRPEHGEITPWVLGVASQDHRIIEKQLFHCLLPEIDAILAGDTAAAADRIHRSLSMST